MPGDWTQETLGAWLLAVRDSDFDGRGVDLTRVRQVATGGYKIQGLAPSKVAETLAGVEAAVEIVQTLKFIPDYRIEEEAINVVNAKASHNIGTLREVIAAVETEDTPDTKMTAALYKLALGDGIPQYLQETPAVVKILEKHLGIKSQPPAKKTEFDPFDL